MGANCFPYHFLHLSNKWEVIYWPQKGLLQPAVCTADGRSAGQPLSGSVWAGQSGTVEARSQGSGWTSEAVRWATAQAWKHLQLLNLEQKWPDTDLTLWSGVEENSYSSSFVDTRSFVSHYLESRAKGPSLAVPANEGPPWQFQPMRALSGSSS